MNVVGIVQARMGSSRLPGKSLMRLGEKTVLEHVLSRVLRAETLSQVVLATTRAAPDDALCAVAEAMGVGVFRGPEDDVLRRYVMAAEAHRADVVVRVCADNPLVAPEEIDRIVKHHLATGADYSFNHRPALGNGYPDGLGAEVVDADVLRALDEAAHDQAHREHVTAYIWDHPDRFLVETVAAPADVAGPQVKLDVDTAEDLARLEALCAQAVGPVEAWGSADIVRAYRAVIGAVA
jgi:spore coat polysaccharide biosynthesis protein SpsF